MNRLQVAVVLLTLFCLSADVLHAQKKPLFTGEELLRSCDANLPLTYGPGKDKAAERRAQELRDVEVVFVSYNRKTRSVTYTRYFVVYFQKDNYSTVYLETPEDHVKTTGTKAAIFRRYNPRFDRFYIARCFDEKMRQHPEIAGAMKPEQPSRK